MNDGMMGLKIISGLLSRKWTFKNEMPTCQYPTALRLVGHSKGSINPMIDPF
jgi:hypothetical protein